MYEIERNYNTGIIEKLLRLGGGYLFQLREWLAVHFAPDRGDEIYMRFTK